mmetsp:Transcript_18331/g.64392  ORF Transcript_18331/g.64392 Transcript_18331/m.64392 type:complete len:262 (+) Transcript_18331:1388-2173(+)
MLPPRLGELPLDVRPNACGQLELRVPEAPVAPQHRALGALLLHRELSRHDLGGLAGCRRLELHELRGEVRGLLLVLCQRVPQLRLAPLADVAHVPVALREPPQPLHLHLPARAVCVAPGLVQGVVRLLQPGLALPQLRVEFGQLLLLLGLPDLQRLRDAPRAAQRGAQPRGVRGQAAQALCAGREVLLEEVGLGLAGGLGGLDVSSQACPLRIRLGRHLLALGEEFLAPRLARGGLPPMRLPLHAQPRGQRAQVVVHLERA